MAGRLAALKRLGALRASVILGGAGGGLIAGHFVHYRLAVPHPELRQELLAVTGHGYLAGASVAAVGLAVVAALTILALGWRRGLRQESAGLPIRTSMLGLGAAQAAGFALLETAERLVSGAPLDHLAGAVFLGGILLQLLIGALVGGLLVVLERSGEAVARAILQRPPRLDPSIPASIFPQPSLLPSRDPLADPLVIRGPPQLFFE